MKYGIPYQGSKSRIAETIINSLPKADVFVDMFAGGCAMTHCAMLSGKYNKFIVNDLNPLPVRLFTQSAHGKYHDCKRWVSRQEFEMFKDIDPFVKYCWSFGNDGRSYLYARDLEPTKKLMHELFFAETPNKRRLIWKRLIKELIKKKYGIRKVDSLERLERIQSLESLERIQSLERLERIQSLESLERIQSLESLERDYADVPIPKNAIIYCDPPYKNTKKYDMDFDHERFYNWACAQSVPVFISEYYMPSDRFECILEIDSTQKMCASKSSHVTEKLFIPK